MRSFFSSFICLNLTQFFSALNDNIYKLLLIFLLITIKGSENSNTILSLAGAVFVIPFILFASFAGTLADRFSKQRIIFYTRLLEIIIMILGVVAFAAHSSWGAYGILFLMATQSAIFSPAKYGIVPEIVPNERISRCNGVLTATTYLAIILGTFLASFLAQITNKNYVASASFCIVIAILGAGTSFGIKKTKPQAANKSLSFRFVSDVFFTLKKARKQRYLVPAIIYGAYFLFVGAFTQLNIIPLSMQSLKLTEIQGGYLFLMTAIGIGIGSMLVGRLSGKEIELGFVPLAALGVTLCFVLIYLFAESFYAVVILLVFLGICGGFYAVPIDAFIQRSSLNEDRGQNVAAANFMSFLGVILASLLLAIFGNVFGLEAKDGFLIIGIITFGIGIALGLVMADQLIRLLVSFAARFFWDLRISGKELVQAEPTLIVGRRSSWLDTVVMMAILPRLVRYIVPVKKDKIPKRAFFYRLLRVIPIDETVLGTEDHQALEEVKLELAKGHSVCILEPNQSKKQHLNDKAVTVEIKRKSLEGTEGKLRQAYSLFHDPIEVNFH